MRRHALAVARLAVRLAPAAGVSPRRARSAAILHDWLKPFGPARLLRLAARAGKRMDAATRSTPALWHGPVASALARRDPGWRDRAVLAAVRWHTTGRRRLAGLDRVLLVADYCAAGRRFREAGVGRRLAVRDLALAVRYVVSGKLAWLGERGLRPHPASLACWGGLWKNLSDV